MKTFKQKMIIMKKFETIIRMAKDQVAIEQSRLSAIDKQIKLKTKGLYQKRKECEDKIKELHEDIRNLELQED